MKEKALCLSIIAILTMYSSMCKAEDVADQASTNPEKYELPEDPLEGPSLPPGIGVISPIPPETVEAEKLIYDIVNEVGKINERGQGLGVGSPYPNCPDGPIY